MLLVLAGIYIRLSGQAFETVHFLPCVFKSVTSIPCPGCGMTRACLAIFQGEFSTAWRYHPFSFLLFGLAILSAFLPEYTQKIWEAVSLVKQRIIASILILLCLGLWLVHLKQSFW
ncbi:TPA: DUF2752 domain-containing protein [Candidatus Poribacteria bacterium]|nr:DUF2752 domain-containing protein [Candidatus Poribacteria bacterium]HIC00965.1 DUF2752 domain-containing protein [Candidatus Poribacteria bacterium]HIO48453.1 DUF2752 domain-containing protein [Candidatus Poribacteria bacterium]HIO80333.1 DUF2752 domain-containing protein [Candidatus Poribacteria bacterium]